MCLYLFYNNDKSNIVYWKCDPFYANDESTQSQKSFISQYSAYKYKNAHRLIFVTVKLLTTCVLFLKEDVNNF